MKQKLQKLFGDRAFLSRVMIFAIPLIIQNGITNFVSLLDNIMVGQVGTVQMSGVSVANQLMLIFNISVFGATSGAGIFTAQFFGSQDIKGVTHSVRYKLYICLALALGGIALFYWKGQDLISLYLQSDAASQAAADTLHYGYEYMCIMLLGFIPFALSTVYASTLRECNQTVLPMVSGIAAVFVNMALNYVLIFGNFGAPRLGVQGAAAATVISRYVELGILMVWTHTHPEKFPFGKSLYRGVYVPGKLAKSITLKGMPLLLNEFLWSSGAAVLSQCYSTCGLDVMPAVNIADTVNNVASIVMVAAGNTVGIMMGQMMGAGKSREEIQDANRKLINIGIFSGVIFGGLMALAAPVLPMIYNTSQQVRALATGIMLVNSLFKPLQTYVYCSYFTMRSGGKTWVTFFYDCGMMWCAYIPLAYCLSRFTQLPIIPLYAICMGVDLFKAAIGFILLKKGTWIQNLSHN